MPNYGGEVELIQCPFNRAHMLLSHRLQYHLIKCRKNYKGTKVACPFNASEYIDPQEMVKHLGQCTFRVLRETHFLYSRSADDTQNPPAPFLHKGLPDSDENWGIDSPDEDEYEGNSQTFY